MIMRKNIGLIAFLKGSSNSAEMMPGCSDYNHHYGGCAFREGCLVEQKKRCGHFEQAILPTAADIGLKERVCTLYRKQVGIEDRFGFDTQLETKPGRNCPDCGAELLPRKRYCEKCTKKRRQDAYRRKRPKKAG